MNSQDLTCFPACCQPSPCWDYPFFQHLHPSWTQPLGSVTPGVASLSVPFALFRIKLINAVAFSAILKQSTVGNLSHILATKQSDKIFSTFQYSKTWDLSHKLAKLTVKKNKTNQTNKKKNPQHNPSCWLELGLQFAADRYFLKLLARGICYMWFTIFSCLHWNGTKQRSYPQHVLRGPGEDRDNLCAAPIGAGRMKLDAAPLEPPLADRKLLAAMHAHIK